MGGVLPTRCVKDVRDQLPSAEAPQNKAEEREPELLGPMPNGSKLTGINT